MRGPVGIVLPALAALTLASVAGAEGARPALALQLGRTFAVGKGFDGAFDQGGFTAAAAALWAWESRFRFGFSVFASDIGNKVERVVLADPSGGPPKDYGTIEVGHVGSYGAGWRVDALGPEFSRGWRSYATAGYQLIRLQADVQGDVVAARTAIGGSLGAGVERSFSPHHALALTGGWTRVFNEEVAQRFANASLESRWRW